MFMKPLILSGPSKGTIPAKHQLARAFTLLELLVVLGTLAVLALMVLPVLAGTKTDTRRIQCEGNLKQLLVGFQLFAQDHNDTLPPAGWENPSFASQQLTWDSWINRYIGGNASDASLQEGVSFPGQATSILACPSDTFPKVVWLGGNNPDLALRSYAMNAVGVNLGSDYEVSDGSRTYPLPDLGVNGRHGVGIWWTDSSPSAPTADWNARGYKTSVVRDPAGTILLCENTHGQQAAGNIWTCICLGPQSATANDLYQIDSNTVQQNPTSSAGINQGIFLYRAQQNSFNYAFHDGHVAALSIGQTIGAGTLASPQGMWTVAPGD
jgi:prepilin-type processing-associated H-X9-DG protein